MIGRMARRRATYLVLAGSGCLLLSTAATSCGGVTCETTAAGPAATFVGRLVALQGPTATFAIETTTPLSGRPTGTPVLVAGQTVAVRYANDEQRFLRVDGRYQVAVWWDGAHFSSGVHTADDPCSGGTDHPDGTAIDTSLWSRQSARRVLVALAIVPVVILALLAVWLRHRHHRKARDSVGS